MRSINAYTLVEILIVIGIIAVLIAILFPILLSARKSANQSTCLSNTRQVVMSIRMYVQDNDNTWPGESPWSRWQDIAGNLPGCPLIKPFVNERDRYKYRHIIGYSYNVALLDDERRPVRKDSDIIFPVTSVVLGESPNNRAFSWGPNPYYGQVYPEGVFEDWKRHNGGANYSFTDGHAKWYLPSQVGYDECPPGNDGKNPSFAIKDVKSCD
jgi:prepilin-type processing-associated H-X9-DG protein